MWWIKASIQDYIVKSWSMVKIGSGVLQKKLFSSVANFKRKYGCHDTEVEKVDSILENSYQTVSLNEKLGKEEGAEFIDTISDCTQTHEENISDKQTENFRVNVLKNAISTLNDREQDIIKQRKLSEIPVTLDVLSKKYNVSSERIRQIEESALKKIKRFAKQT
jgi:RNA polymerase sigma-32 factor